MKKIFTLFLSFLLVLGTTGAVFASSLDVKPNTEKKLDTKLKKLGFPDEYISILPLEQKQDIIESDPVGFGGFEKTDFYLDENGQMQEIKQDEISIMGTIPKADMTLWNGRSDLGYINGRKTYRIYVNWEWHISPWFGYEDKIALSYNDEFQTRVSNNGNYTCKSYVKSTDSNYSKTTDCFGRPSEITFGGAAWNYDIAYGGQMLNSGWAMMDIESKKNNKPSGTGIILSKYYHKTGVSGSIGLSIGYVSISVSSGSGYDEAAAQSSWNY
jgi:hypothetical protein